MCLVHVCAVSQFPAVNVGLLDYCLPGAALWVPLSLTRHMSRRLSGRVLHRGIDLLSERRGWGSSGVGVMRVVFMCSSFVRFPYSPPTECGLNKLLRGSALSVG